MRCSSPRLLIACAAFSTLSAVAWGQSLTLVPSAISNGALEFYGVSADGSKVAGWDVLQYGLIWTSAAGKYDLHSDNGILAGAARAISGDGSTVVGQGADGAYIWSGPGTFRNIGHLAPYSDAEGEGVSGNGSVVVGRSYAMSGPVEVSEAFRWTAATGLQPLGFINPGDFHSEAYAVSRDGSTVVGESSGSRGDAFVWRESTGMVRLQPLPGTAGEYSSARGVSANGDIIVGTSGEFNDFTVWRSGVPTSLGRIAGGGPSFGEAVSDDGNVIVGFTSAPSGNIATIWTPTRGLEPLVDYLAANGITVPSGITLANATGISADGKTIVGYTHGFFQPSDGFVITIPTPMSLVPLLGVLAAARFRRRSLSAGSPPLP